jgi:phosphoribosylformylglycinamidine cyclo-ligase
MPPLFRWLRDEGRVDAQEMYRVFNCGIGMVVIVSAEQADAAEANLRDGGETVYRLGLIESRSPGAPQTTVR